MRTAWARREEAPVAHVHLAAGPADRAHLLALDLAATVTGRRDLTLLHACASCGSADHGRPVLSGPAGAPVGVHVSLARTGAAGSGTAGTALVAVSPEAAVGVDLEQRPTDGPELAGLAGVVLHRLEAADPTLHAPSARAVLRAWVRKEALLKAHGVGLTRDPRTVALADDGSVLVGPATTVLDLHPARLREAGASGPETVLAALAVVGRRRVEVTWH